MKHWWHWPAEFVHKNFAYRLRIVRCILHVRSYSPPFALECTTAATMYRFEYIAQLLCVTHFFH